ncbi:MAG: hypothetical protein KIT00_13050 [Rhodospirillales bacterium]|nr:hypothetical protein [Rhodospirillales bacterium]
MMSPLSLAGIAATLALAVAPASAADDPTCSQREKILNGLAEQYKEFVRYRALAAEGLLLEVFAQCDQKQEKNCHIWTEGGTFTIVVTRPDGVSCLMAAGQAWHDVSFSFRSDES